MTLKELCKKYNGKTIKDAGGVNSKEMRKFAADFQSAIRAFCKITNVELVRMSLGHYNVSGFIKDTYENKYFYISYNVPRCEMPINIQACSPMDGVLYRTAESDKDYHGGYNRFSSLNALEENLTYLIGSYFS